MMTLAEIAIGLVVSVVAMEIAIGTWMCIRIAKQLREDHPCNCSGEGAMSDEDDDVCPVCHGREFARRQPGMLRTNHFEV